MLIVNIQHESQAPAIPDTELLQQWAEAALPKENKEAELTIRVVDEEESATLNEKFRKEIGPTNVLAFHYGDDEHSPQDNYLGDIIICAPIVAQESQQQKKPLQAHWAHLVIHGILHLLGHDHQKSDDAHKMESREISLLENLGYPNPYITTQLQENSQ